MPRPKLPTTLTPSARRKAWEAARKAEGYVRRQALLSPAVAARVDDLMAKNKWAFSDFISHALTVSDD